MSHKITHSYNYYQTPQDRFLIKTFHINYMPFTFDEIPSIAQDDPEIIEEATRNPIMTPNILFLNSYYLIAEEAHPLLFEVNLENPEVLEEIS
jgi:hypothetical protein